MFRFPKLRWLILGWVVGAITRLYLSRQERVVKEYVTLEGDAGDLYTIELPRIPATVTTVEGFLYWIGDAPKEAAGPEDHI